MLQNPQFASTDRSHLRALVDGYPWATIVSAAGHDLVASHYPILWESSPEADELTLVTHFGRPDDLLHELGTGDVLVIVQGPHAYISPSWYPVGHFVPTWNHITAHLRCSVELLSPDENFQVLSRLVETFEGQKEGHRRLDDFGEAARHVAVGTAGVRLRVSSFEMLEKLSQNKPAGTVASIIQNLSGTSNDLNARLVDAMRIANSAKLSE